MFQKYNLYEVRMRLQVATAMTLLLLFVNVHCDYRGPGVLNNISRVMVRFWY